MLILTGKPIKAESAEETVDSARAFGRNGLPERGGA
jgi:hypothetical protein